MDNATKEAKKARWCRVKNERNTSHPQVPATPNGFPTFEPSVSEHGGVLIPNIPILCDDVVRRIDVVFRQSVIGATLNPSPVVWMLAYRQKAIVCADVIVMWCIMLATLIAIPIMIVLKNASTIVMMKSTCL